MCKHLLLGDLDLAVVDVVRDGLGAAAIDLAAGGESSSEDLENGTLEGLGHRLEAHGAGNGDDLVKRNGLGVLDVLLLLAVPGGLLKGLDDEGRSGGNDGDGGLTVLDGQLDGDAQTLPVAGGLGDIFTDLCRIVSNCFSQRRMRNSALARLVKYALLGERPRGPILGARAEEAPTSPPVARRWMTLTSEGSNLGAAAVVSQAVAADQKDDTHAWLVREVVCLF